MELRSFKNRLSRAYLTRVITFGTKRLIIFLTPGFDLRAGGVMAILSMMRETIALRHLHRAKVALCAVPGDDPNFVKYTWFDNDDYLLSLDGVLKGCGRLDYLQLHIPDYAVNLLLDWLTSAAGTLLKNIGEIHLNVLLFNIDNIQGQNVRGLLSFGKATCTTAHEAYSNLATRQAQGVPLHRLGCLYGPELFPRSGYHDKEPLLIVSHDGHPLKTEVLESIARAFPDLKIQIIHGLHYEEYRKLLRRAKWALTFGEGLDSYFGDTILSGGVAFAVFNDRYFTSEYAKLENVYPSWEVLMDRITTDLRRLDEPVAYDRCSQEGYDLLSAYCGTDRFRENLRLFYCGEYTFQ